MINITADQGGVIIPRSLLQSMFWVGLKPAYRLALFEILCHAVTEEKLYFRCGEWRSLYPGQVLMKSEHGIGDLTPRQTRAFLEKLKAEGIITFETWKGGEGGGGTVVTVLNWLLYSDHSLYERESKS